jgi:hypothetical protein
VIRLDNGTATKEKKMHVSRRDGATNRSPCGAAGSSPPPETDRADGVDQTPPTNKTA